MELYESPQLEQVTVFDVDTLSTSLPTPTTLPVDQGPEEFPIG